VAFVTGAGSGIGAGIARLFAQAGAAVVCTDINGASARKVAAEIEAAGGSSEAAPVDVTDAAAVEAAIADAVRRHGRLDALCNAAGIMVEADAIDLTEQDFDRILAVNLKGVLFTSQSAARRMGRESSIVNIASVIIDKPSRTRMAYAVSKAGVVQLTRGFALELGERGIRVNAIAPGWIVTGMTSRHFTDAEGRIDTDARDRIFAQRAATSPLNMIGDPTDIAYAALYLASDASRFMTGQVLRPNGGVVMV
jgi:3-oxoacyl-[acyl-carrier protein] reductase